MEAAGEWVDELDGAIIADVLDEVHGLGPLRVIERYRHRDYGELSSTNLCGASGENYRGRSNLQLGSSGSQAIERIVSPLGRRID